MVIFVIVIVLLYLFCFLTGKDGFKEIILALLTWPVLISVFLSWLVMLFKEQIRNIHKKNEDQDTKISAKTSVYNNWWKWINQIFVFLTKLVGAILLLIGLWKVLFGNMEPQDVLGL